MTTKYNRIKLNGSGLRKTEIEMRRHYFDYPDDNEKPWLIEIRPTPYNIIHSYVFKKLIEFKRHFFLDSNGWINIGRHV